MIANLYGHSEAGMVYATGVAPDGSPYTAVADDWDQLRDRIRESAKAEGWLGWSLATGTVLVQ